MKTVCSFCGAVVRQGNSPDDPVSHGICRTCYDRILTTFGVNIRRFLDLLDAPVFLVDDDVTILAANTPALVFLDGSRHQVTGRLCGTALECSNACLPEGCGKTPYCPDCTIRNTVNETFMTGLPVIRRPAAVLRSAGRQTETVQFLVTTKKDGNVVLLRLEPHETE